MANSYSAPNFNVDTSCNIADLVTLKGSAIASTDNIYIYNGALLTCEQSFSCLKIYLGVTSGGAATGGNRYGLITFNAGITVTFAGNATNTNSGIQSNPTSADTSSKGCSIVSNGTLASPVTFTNSVNSNNASNRYVFGTTYGIIDIKYAIFNYYYGTTVFNNFPIDSTKTNATIQKIQNCTIGIPGTGTSVFLLPNAVACNIPCSFTFLTMDLTGVVGGAFNVLSQLAGGGKISTGGYYDLSGFYSFGGNGPTIQLGGYVSATGSNMYTSKTIISSDDIRPTQVIPTGLTLTDLQNSTVKVEVSNISSLTSDNDMLEVYLSNGTTIYTISKYEYVNANESKPANCGIIAGLTQNTTYTGIYAKYTSDMFNYGDASAAANDVTVTVASGGGGSGGGCVNALHVHV